MSNLESSPLPSVASEVGTSAAKPTSVRLLLIGGEHFGEIKGFQGERLLAPVLFAQTRIRS